MACLTLKQETAARNRRRDGIAAGLFLTSGFASSPMKKSLTFLTLLAFSFMPPSVRADGPTPYPDAKDEAAWPGKGPIRVGAWMMDNRKAFWPKREKDRGSIVFVGDSLIGGYKVADAFSEYKVAIRAVGGEVTRGLLFRLKEDVIDLKPQAVVICAGSNDLSCRSNPDLAVENLAEAITTLRASNPKLPIILCLVTPREAPKAPITEGSLQQLNAGIRRLAEGKENVFVADVFTPLATPEGKPIPEYFAKDGIHILPAGYAKWTEQLAPLFRKLDLK
jgi:lysophospholipase L1-like esterase